MLKRLEPLPRFVLGMTSLIVLLAIPVGFWWWLPARPFATLPPPGDHCKQLRISSDGRVLLAIHEQHLAIWDVERQREIARCPFRWVSNDETQEIVWLSPDGRTVAFVDGDHAPAQVRLWNCELKEKPILLPDSWGIQDEVLDSSTLVTHGKGRIRLWNTAGREIPLPAGREETIISVQHLRDRNLLIGIDREIEHGWLVDPVKVTVWIDLAGQAKSLVLPGGQLPVVVSPDGKLIAAALGDHTGLYDAATGRLIAELPRPVAEHEDIPRDFSPDSRMLVTSADQVRIWDVRAMPPRMLARVEVLQPTFIPMFAADSAWAGMWDRVAYTSKWSGAWGWRLYDTRTWQTVGRIQHELIHRPTFAPQGPTITGVANGEDEPSMIDRWLRPTRGAIPYRAVKVWELPTGQELTMFPGGIAYAYFPDGQRIAIGTEDGSIQFWDLPPSRPWYIDYGLPVLVALLILLAVRMGWRGVCTPPASVTTDPAVSELA
jgi:WD40 repeat protein